MALLDLAAGWGLGVDFFVRLRPGYPAMVPGTAFCLLMGSAGTAATALGRPGWLRTACGAAIPAVVLATYVVPAFDLGPDAMSIGTAIACLSVAACLLSGLLPRRGDRVLLAAGTFGLSIAAIPLLGYVFNAEALFSNPVYTEMALHTAAGFTLLLLALLLLVPETGWMRVATAPERGSQMFRRLLPVVIFGPVVLTALTLAASRRDLLSPDLRAAVLTYAMIAVTGSAAMYFAHLANLSERRAAEAERQRLESERTRQAVELAMERGQRVESLGRLVGGVAHDFNNTLAVIVGNLELLQNDRTAGARDGYVREALGAADQAATLTGQLLSYGRKSRLEPAPAQIDGLVHEALEMFRRLCPAGISVTVRLAAPQAVAELDATGFRQALLNLLINARDAQPEGGHIEIATSIEQRGQDTVAGFSSPEALWPGRFALVTVTDAGPGMDPRVLAMATDPFFTTKPVGEGTGLGLSVASGFCRQSGGGLTLENSAGGGLSARMAVPLVRAAAEAGPAVPGAARVLHAPGRRILIVEDDPKVRQVMARRLELDGHAVETCATAAEALALFATGYRPDLAITDLAMPGAMQGGALSRWIRTEHPEVPVVLMSGYESPREASDRQGSGERFLQKPVNWQVLREVVASIPPPDRGPS
ncbi:response regulator [Poseidonocella sp. HB161398]|uniref:response regulator n=1 Tax=Poseidonocella sp. HB161398 TaxID=2320855 RepID=UPI001485FF4A|nr:response regulator [Poseidonocella sp. HB161398]